MNIELQFISLEKNRWDYVHVPELDLLLMKKFYSRKLKIERQDVKKRKKGKVAIFSSEDEIDYPRTMIQRRDEEEEEEILSIRACD